MPDAAPVKVAGFVPCKLNSERVPGKNVRELGGTPLVNWCLRTLAAVPEIDETFVYASSDEICRYIEPGSAYTYVQRPPWLDTQDAKVQDFVGEFLKAVKAEVYVLLHITSPFIRASTVSACVSAVLSGKHDSAFAVEELRRFAWFDGQPLNYSLDRPVPRTQDLEPVTCEQGGLYVFRHEVFAEHARRIGDTPLLRPVGPFEGHDIDVEDDFVLAESIVAAGLAQPGSA
jgi:CMP-N-acetylneuraminic acid synthetase